MRQNSHVAATVKLAYGYFYFLLQVSGFFSEIFTWPSGGVQKNSDGCNNLGFWSQTVWMQISLTKWMTFSSVISVFLNCVRGTIEPTSVVT